MTTKSKLILNSILGILLAYSLFIFWKVPQPYGKIAIVILLIGLCFNFLNNHRLGKTVFTLAIAGSSFVLVAGTQFMLDNIQKRKLFDLDTAVHFDKTTFDEALKKAQQLKKPIFIDFYTAWCGPCLEFSRNVLTDNEVGEVMNSAFINLKFDAEKGEGISLAKRYDIHGYPALIIVDPQGNLVEYINKEHLMLTKKLMMEASKKYLSVR